jgi:hypothetical protein
MGRALPDKYAQSSSRARQNVAVRALIRMPRGLIEAFDEVLDLGLRSIIALIPAPGVRWGWKPPLQFERTEWPRSADSGHSAMHRVILVDIIVRGLRRSGYDPIRRLIPTRSPNEANERQRFG